MCGIFGYTGAGNAAETIIKGLKKLEYRGYDSAGFSVSGKSGIMTLKQTGKVSELEKKYFSLKKHEKQKYRSTCGIGHTRWATHGAVTLENCHPHISYDESISIVHNGTIENYMELKNDLINQGILPSGDTDSEIIAHLVSLNYHGCLMDAVVATLPLLKGSYALAIMSAFEENTIIAVKKGSPLIIGNNGEEVYISSDIPALAEMCGQVYVMQDNELAFIKPEQVKFYKEGKEIEKNKTYVYENEYSASLHNYKYYMEKEIHEIPTAVENTFNNILLDKELLNKIALNVLRADRIMFVGCGTAYHAAAAASYMYESRLKKPCRSILASEFLYSPPYIDNNTVCFFISQSGSTADTLNAVRYAREKNALTISVTNVHNSSICFDSDIVVYTSAGAEIAVASTKAYNSQLTAMLSILRYIRFNYTEQDQSNTESYTAMPKIVMYIKRILSDCRLIYEIASSIKRNESLFYIGRGLDYITAREGALKLKETAYLFCEALAAGELKHGTLALISQNVKVIAVVTQDKIKDKMKLAIEETRARGADIIIVSQFREFNDYTDKFILLPEADYEAMPILSIVPLQLLAFYTSRNLGYSPDKPRNLAKSVTVE